MGSKLGPDETTDEKARDCERANDTIYGFILGTPNPSWEKSVLLRQLELLYHYARKGVEPSTTPSSSPTTSCTHGKELYIPSSNTSEEARSKGPVTAAEEEHSW